MRWPWCAGVVVLASALALAAQGPPALDAEGRRWVEQTMASLSLDQRVGQLLALRLGSTYLASGSRDYEDLVALLRDTHAGHLVAFGGSARVPRGLANARYATAILGDPLSLASTVNRLQAAAELPLLVAADFEWGAGMRIDGATHFPRAMAFGAAGDERLTAAAAEIAGRESRAMGVHVNFAPVADVNSNPRNPVINIRSFGEDPARVAAHVAASLRGLHAGGMLATLKHFPGQGDADVDSHLDLPTIHRDRASLEATDLRPFAAGIAAGADGVMVAHIQVPALDPESGPATFSRPIATGVLRGQLGFGGLAYSDAMRMQAIAAMLDPGEAAVRAVLAGMDVLVDTPDPRVAFRALRAAADEGRLPRARLDEAVRRVLTAKARLGLQRQRRVSLDVLPEQVGGGAHAAVAREVAERAVTLVADRRDAVPLPDDRARSVLYLSVLDYPAEWGTGAPGRTMLPELRRRWRDVQAVELSDRSSADDLSLVAAMAPRFDAIVAGVFVRAASGSGRLDLAPALADLLSRLGAAADRRNQPFIVVSFGNPYVAAQLTAVPALLLTFDLSDAAEAAAVRALAGEIAIGGRLPIALPGLFPRGHGLTRAARATASGAAR